MIFHYVYIQKIITFPCDQYLSKQQLKYVVRTLSIFIENKKIMKLPYVNLGYQWKDEQKNPSSYFKTLRNGEYVGGKEIKKFETSIAKICGKKFAVALNSGTDALTFIIFIRN